MHAVALVWQGATQLQICRDLGVLKSALSKRLTDADRAERGLPATSEVSRGEDAQRGLEFRYRILADEMLELGYAITERRVWRLCKQAGIHSVIPKRKGHSKQGRAPVGDDLVALKFTAPGPNQLWLTDITEHWTNEDCLYMCAVKDVWSKRIVGYSIGAHMQASLAVRALENTALQRDYPVGTVVHSDRGGQFRSQIFQDAVRRHQLRGSMGRVSAAGDNAAMESFCALLQKNVLDWKVWASREQLRLAIVSWVERKYHRRRRQRRLGRLTPVEFEVASVGSVSLAA